MDELIHNMNVARMSVIPPTIRHPNEQREFTERKFPIFVDDGWISPKKTLPDVQNQRKSLYTNENPSPEWVRDKILYENTQYKNLPMPLYDREMEETGHFTPGFMEHTSLKRYNDPASDTKVKEFKQNYYQNEDHIDLLRRIQSEVPHSENMIDPMNKLLGFGINADVHEKEEDGSQQTARQKPVRAKPFAETPPTNYLKDNDLEESILSYYRRNMKSKRTTKASTDKRENDSNVTMDSQVRDPKAKRRFWQTQEAPSQTDENVQYQEASARPKRTIQSEIDKNITVDDLSINDLGDVKLHVRNNKTKREYDISFNIADDTDLIAELNQHISTHNYHRVKATILQRLSDTEALPIFASDPVVKERKIVTTQVSNPKNDIETYTANIEMKPKVKKQINRTVDASIKSHATTDFKIEANVPVRTKSRIDTYQHKISPFR